MPIGYVMSVAVVAWCTLFAVRPPRLRHSSPSSRAFWFGFLVNELPFVALAWLVAATVLAAVQGDLVTPVGLVGLGLAIVAVAGIVVIVRRSLLAKPVLARALADADVNSISDNDGSTRWARIVLWPFPTRGRQVARIADLTYGDAGRGNRLDVYRPRGRRPVGPTIVHLHGGAFRSGNKSREARPLLHRLARRGCVCISANYRLTPEARFPDQLIDAKRVVAWVREHGPRYGADPSRVIVGGSSAGAHLASTPPDRRPHRTTTWGADRPPFFVAHGDLDTIVIVEDARRFVDHLRSTSERPVVYAELPGAQHDFDLVHSIRFEAVVDAVEAFLDRERHQ
jgi:acetyl esterase/lipase